MFPNWHDALVLPTVGDKLVIAYVITVDAPPNPPTPISVFVERTSTEGDASVRGKAIGFLLRRTHTDTSLFLDKFLALDHKKNAFESFSVDLKNLLENHRSALEYVAHYVADICEPKPKPKNVKFPIAAASNTRTTFSTKLNTWFPMPNKSHPEMVDYLAQIQGFSGETWLQRLAELSNFNKHHMLSELEVADFRSTTIGVGQHALRIGELGFTSVELQNGGILRFPDASGTPVDVCGPCIIDAETTNVSSVDRRFEVSRKRGSCTESRERNTPSLMKSGAFRRTYTAWWT